MLSQPTAALRQGLGMGQHFCNASKRSITQQGMTNRQHQSPADAKVPMHPKGIQGGRHPALH